MLLAALQAKMKKSTNNFHRTQNAFSEIDESITSDKYTQKRSHASNSLKDKLKPIKATINPKLQQ